MQSRPFGNKKGSTFFYKNMLPFLVEAAGVEPASEIFPINASTSVVTDIDFSFEYTPR